jgi:hypothetical protein
VEALLAFAAALVSLRLAGGLLRRGRTPHRLAWAAALASYGIACAALAWGAAAGWNDAAFRVYYLFGGLLTAPLLGLGSLLLAGVRRVTGPVLVYVGISIGVVLSGSLTAPVSGTSIPAAQEHLDFLPGRLLAVLGNSLGTIAVVGVALWSIRRRPVGNALVVAGVAVSALGSALAGLREAETAALLAAGAVLLYGGFVSRR